MRDFTKRRGKGDMVRRFIFGAFMVSLLALVTFGAVRASWNMYGKFVEAANGNEAAQQNLVQLKAHEASVRAEVASLSSPEGQEAQLRQSYGVALPGEGQIQIVRQSASTTPKDTHASGNFFMRIIRALFFW